MRLSYDADKARRCISCDALGGQYPLREIVEWGCLPNGHVLLSCGHVEYSLDEFRVKHPEWTWPTTPQSNTGVEL